MLKSKNRSALLVIFVSLLALAGCASRAHLLMESPAAIATGQALIDEGKAMISDGDAMVKQGKNLRSEGEDLIDKGEDLRNLGNEKITLGKRQIKAVEMLEEAEALRLKGQQLQQNSKP